MRNQPSQPVRLFALFLYLILLVVASKVALGGWLPPTSEKGLWFYAGLAALLLGNLIVSPFFTKPADSISNAVSGIVALLAVNVLADGSRAPFERVLWSCVFGYLVIVLVASVVAIASKPSESTWGRALAQESFSMATRLGDARPTFAAVFFFAVITFHRGSGFEFAVLSGVGLIVVVIRPIERIASLMLRISQLLRNDESTLVGEMIGREEPSVVIVRQRAASTVSTGTVVAVRSGNATIDVGVVVNRFLLAGESWFRVVCLDFTVLPESQRIGLVPETAGPESVVALSTEAQARVEAALVGHPLSGVRERLVGLVVPETDLNTLVAEITNTTAGIEEGRLLQTRIGKRDVLYQVIAGVSREEILEQHNRYGYARARARKIGTWNAERRTFDRVRWIPGINEPVLLLQETERPNDHGAIGYIPGTAYPISIDPHRLVTHNTAILGILGVGKTMLAFDLIHRLLDAHIKVICIDITSEYASEFGFQPSNDLSALVSKTAWGKTSYKPNKEEGGAIREFESAIQKLIADFVADAGQSVLVIDPGAFDVWEQTGGMFQGTAAMSSLTPTEVTRIISEASLEAVQAIGKSDTARVCLVFEEAHAIVPEWNSAAADGDRLAANGTAKAILQGRKYGLGCLVITQRTANVTKTILNQCNTLFAMRVYDSTGLEYLGNYIGADYAGLLSGLDDRHAVVFGKASSCADPVMIRLNDRPDPVLADPGLVAVI